MRDIIEDMVESVNVTISEQEKIAEDALENGSVHQAAREQVRLSAMVKVKMEMVNALARGMSNMIQET